jgi:16S rRNA (cytosine967-C5)-methyltransferase
VIAPARVCAYAVLRRVFEQGAYADRALRSEARVLDTRDRALAQRIAYGAIQRRGTLDHLIERLSERPPRRLDAPVLAALRLGAYELLYTGGAPDRAIVADAVELSKTHARAGHGLVNAVLRRATREGARLLAELGEDTPEQAAVKHSHPEWIARTWWRQLGPERTRALMAADNEPSELALRANTLLTDAPTLARELGRDGVRVRLDPAIPEALVLEGPFDAHRSRHWREGAFIAQSRAAMLVGRVLAPEPGQNVLDLCAAPGGKSTHIAALMGGTGRVVAVERDRRRAGALLRTAERLHAGNVHVELADATRSRAERVFDRVLVDPPCSGLGTLQAHADLRWRMTPARASELERIQARILAAGAQALRPGGVLVYSTCTISSTENERQIFTLLDANRELVLDDLGAVLPGLGHPPVFAPNDMSDVSRQTALGKTVLTLPHRDHTAGFFIARLRREG